MDPVVGKGTLITLKDCISVMEMYNRKITKQIYLTGRLF